MRYSGKKCFKEPRASVLKAFCKKIMNSLKVCPMTFLAKETAP